MVSALFSEPHFILVSSASLTYLSQYKLVVLLTSPTESCGSCYPGLICKFGQPRFFFAHPRSGQSKVSKTCWCSCGVIWHNCRVRCCNGSKIPLRFCGIAFANCTHVVAALLFANCCKPIVFAPLCLAAN